MIGGKGKGGDDHVVSLMAEELRALLTPDEADAAIERFLRGDDTPADRQKVVAALVAAEARARASRLVAPQECESGEGA
jgi:hypothetical protein